MNLAIIPNLVSLIRIVLVIPIIGLLYQSKFEMALLLFLVACVTDVIDGYLARRFNWQSKLGGWLDPIADKFLLNCVYFALWLLPLPLVPIWLLVCVLGRDLLIVAGVVYFYFRIEKINAKPTIISKINTFMQLVLVIFILIDQALKSHAITPIPEAILATLMYGVLGLTLVSGGWYVIIGIKRAFVVRKGWT